MGQPEAPVFEAREVDFSYGDLTVLDGLSLSVSKTRSRRTRYNDTPGS